MEMGMERERVSESEICCYGGGGGRSCEIGNEDSRGVHIVVGLLERAKGEGYLWNCIFFLSFFFF